MAEIIRVAEDSDAVVVKVDDKFCLVSEDLTVSEKVDSVLSLFPLAESKYAWRKPVEEDAQRFSTHMRLATGEVIEEPKPIERSIRLPKSMQISIAENLHYFKSNDEVYARLEELSTRTTTTPSEVQWLEGELNKARSAFAALGGDSATNWFTKINKSSSLVAAAFEPDEDLEYFGTAEQEGTTKVTGLIAVDRDDDLVLQWVDGAFSPLTESVSEYEAGSIVELDEDTARAVAEWLDNPTPEDPDGIEVTEVDPLEKNLFDLAAEDIALVADATGYSPIERANNASRQQRSNNGDFAGPQVESTGELAGFSKSRLDPELPVLEDPAARLDEYLTAGSTEPLYLALVDETDTAAVLDVAAITLGEDGTLSAAVRGDGTWNPAPEMVTGLQGADSPKVVELPDNEQTLEILSDIDEFDTKTEEESDDRGDAAITASGSTLYAEYGEIIVAPIVAAATPAGVAGGMRLREYWTHGKGAAKIRWGTKGDLTRAHRHLAKYVGPQRAWALAQSYHIYLFGVSNAKRDKAMGH